MARRRPGRKWTNKLGRVFEDVADEGFDVSLGVALGGNEKRKTPKPEEAVKPATDRGDLSKR